jgi:hypothetical protein
MSIESQLVEEDLEQGGQIFNFGFFERFFKTNSNFHPKCFISVHLSQKLGRYRNLQFSYSPNQAVKKILFINTPLHPKFTVFASLNKSYPVQQFLTPGKNIEMNLKLKRCWISLTK